MAKKSGVSIRSAAGATRLNAQRDQSTDSAIQLRIEESERATLCSTLNNRPINTERWYEGYQNEFVEWCNGHSFCGGGTVTKGKLHLFLTEQAVGRESKKQKIVIVGGSTVCGYVNAVVDMCNQQVALRDNSNEQPGSPSQAIDNERARPDHISEKEKLSGS
ncbi:unnamed protein product [Phytophthora lilii]|uniref:Unnamed protein product n=1 Tax=Phytophthora lilii TaxID=2077276 RepID=A0A9W6YHH2_9STRA|nr:unnamed protein product [Phytophthora lilii]